MEVSVIIPVYNAAPFVAGAVRSAIEQPEVREVFLVEDGSLDGSLEVCRQLEAAHPQVRLLRHPEGANHGAGASRNLGMQHAGCPFIAFLDADDHFLPDRFRAERSIFGGSLGVDGVYGAIGAHFHDEEQAKRFANTYAVQLTTVRYRVAPEHLFDAHLGLHRGVTNLGHFSLDGLTLRRAALDRMPEWMRSDLRLRQDTEFILRAAWYLRLAPGEIEQPVSSRGLHGDNRVTNDPKRPMSRYMLYAALSDWAKREGIGKERCATLDRLACTYRLQWACADGRLLLASRIMVTTPSLWRRLDMIYIYIDALLGKGSWPGRMLKGAAFACHRLFWALRGGVPQEVAASWAKLQGSVAARHSA